MEGTANVVISFDAWPEGKVAPTTHELTVLAPKKGPKREPVTDRLIKTLAHPDRKATIGDLRFSADGTRLMMTGYPSGVIQIWDTKTWKEAARMNTPSGLRSSYVYANPTPDWKTLLVHVRTRKVVREDKAGKVHERLQVDGRIDRYDLEAGKLLDSIPFADRGPTQLFVAPDGKFALVNTEGSFAATAKKRPACAELVDLTAGTSRQVFDTNVYPAFARDGRAVYLSKYEFQANGRVPSSLVKYDLLTGKEEKSVKTPDGETFFDSVTVSPDGKWVVTSHRKLKPASVTMVILAADTLEEVGRIPGPKDAERNTYFDPALFSADGGTMVTRCDGPVIAWDVAGKKVIRTVSVGEFQFGRLAVSPDGRWAAVAGLPKFDVKAIGRDPDPRDLPQPRVVLIDLKDAKREPQVLMLPEGAVGGVAFGRDGKTLAVGAQGGVHLIAVR